MTNEEMFRRVTDALGELATVRHTLVEMQEELQKERGKSRWTERDVEFTKSMKKLYPNACRVQRSVNGKDVAVFSKDGTMLLEMHGNPFCFPRLEPGEPVKVDEIIGGAE